MNKKVFVIGGFILIFLIGILLGIPIGKKYVRPCPDCLSENQAATTNVGNIDIRNSMGNKYYIMTGEYNGEYDYQNIKLSQYYENQEEAMDKIKLFNTSNILNYDEYSKFCQKWGLKQKYNDVEKKYMVISYASYGQLVAEAKIANVLENEGKVTVYIWDHTDGDSADIAGYFIAVPINIDTNQVEVVNTINEEEYDLITNGNDFDTMVKKPIIYIYPKEKTSVKVKLANPDLLTVSYPKYESGWKVVATPDGNLLDEKTGKNYYGLYYESRKKDLTMKDDGFIVKGKDSSEFLEEKLTILGLNDRERNEFIIYWLPILEANKYNYIRFETDKEINSYMPLEVDPKPETMIRVIMDYKPLDKKMKVKEQKLISKQRKGYTLVEWGANEIK